MNYHILRSLAGAIFFAQLLLFLLCSGCGEKKETDKVARTIPVRTSSPKERLFEKMIKVEGSVEPVNYADLCSRVSGVIDSIMVDEGSIVKKDQPLFQIDKLNLENSLEVARQNLMVTDASVKKVGIDLEISKIYREKAQIDFNRAETLKISKVISADEHEKADLNLKKCTANIGQMQAELMHAEAVKNQAKSNVDIAVKELADSMIKAPFDGVITKKFMEIGEYADKSNKILEIEDPMNLEVVALITAKHYDSILPGKTLARIISGGKKCEAPVSYRSPSVDPDGRTFEIKIRLPADSGFVSGMLCEVFLVAESRKAMGVPSEAIVEKSDSKNCIFIFKGGKAETCPVIIGIEQDGWTEITTDADILGAQVIVSGQVFLENASPVRMADTAKKE